MGAVLFCIGSGIEKNEKVFAAAELPVLARNHRVDAITKDVIADYQRCAQAGQPAVNFGYVSV